MNYAVIIAGGSGNRMGQDIPKQFINVYDKPVLIYTLEGFQRHPMIDAIEGYVLKAGKVSYRPMPISLISLNYVG